MVQALHRTEKNEKQKKTRRLPGGELRYPRENRLNLQKCPNGLAHSATHKMKGPGNLSMCSYDLTPNNWFEVKPLRVLSPIEGKLQLIMRFSWRRVMLASTITEPSFCGMISRLSAAMSVVRFPQEYPPSSPGQEYRHIRQPQNHFGFSLF